MKALRGHQAEISHIHVEGETIVSGDVEGWIRVWPKVVFRAHTRGVLSLVVWQDRLLSQGRDGYLRVWTMTGTLVDSYALPCLSFCKMCTVSERELTLYAPEENAYGVQRVVYNSGWRVDHRDIVPHTHDDRPHCGNAMAMALDEMLCVGYEDGCVACFHPETLELLWSHAFYSEPVFSVCITDGVAYVGSAVDSIKWRSLTHNAVGELHLNGQGVSSILAVRGDLWCACWDNSIRICTIASDGLEPKDTLPGQVKAMAIYDPPHQPHSLVRQNFHHLKALQPTAPFVVYGGTDGVIHLVNFSS
jgi:hypothetical protein